MKRGTDLKLKFKLLQNKLELRMYVVKGLLQAIWDFTTENAPLGDIGRFSDDEIAIGIDWPAERAAELIEALVSAHWLDRSKEHRLIVHDWHEHVEEWLRKRIIRSGKRFASEDGGQRQPMADNGSQWQTTADNGSLPEPGPVPVPDPSFPPTPQTGGGRAGGVDPLRKAVEDTVNSIWYQHGVPPSQVRAHRKTVDDLTAIRATPGEIVRRHERMESRFGMSKATPRALVKHWGSFEPLKDPDDE